MTFFPSLLMVGLVLVAGRGASTGRVPSKLQRLRTERRPSSHTIRSDGSTGSLLLKRWLDGRAGKQKQRRHLTQRRVYKEDTRRIEQKSGRNERRGVMFDLMEDTTITELSESTWEPQQRQMTEVAVTTGGSEVGVPGRRNQTTVALEKELNDLQYDTYIALLENATYAPSVAPTLPPAGADPQQRRVLNTDGVKVKRKIPSNAFTVTGFDETDDGRQLVQRDTSRSRVYGVYVTKLEQVSLSVNEIIKTSSRRVSNFAQRHDLRATAVHISNNHGKEVDGIVFANTDKPKKKQLLYPVDYRTYIKREELARRERRTLLTEEKRPFTADSRRRPRVKKHRKLDDADDGFYPDDTRGASDLQGDPYDLDDPEFYDELLLQCPSEFRDNSEFFDIHCLRDAYIYFQEELKYLDDVAEEDLNTYEEMLYDLDTDRAESLTRLSVQCATNVESVLNATRNANSAFNASAVASNQEGGDSGGQRKLRERILRTLAETGEELTADDSFEPTHIFDCMSRDAPKLNHLYARLYNEVRLGHYDNLDARAKEGEWLFAVYEEDVSYCCGQEHADPFEFSLDYDDRDYHYDDDHYDDDHFSSFRG